MSKKIDVTEPPLVRLRVMAVRFYYANPVHYGTDDPDAMAAVDADCGLIELLDHPDTLILVDHADADTDATVYAAAPDLLKALQAVVRVADRATDAFDLARAAIAKATGVAP